MITKLLLKILPERNVYAHCDVPCGIYDPKSAQTAAATALKMVQKIGELPTENASQADRNSFVRMVVEKEEQAQLCKEELLILWTDYFKPEHLEKYPNLHDTFWKATKLCSKVKQTVDEDACNQLVKAVNEIADSFAETKKT